MVPGELYRALKDELEAAEQKLTDIRAIDRGWPETMTDADKLREVKRIAGRAPSVPEGSSHEALQGAAMRSDSPGPSAQNQEDSP